MLKQSYVFLLILALGMRAETPPLLSEAVQRFAAVQGDMAFTQETKSFLADGTLKLDRVERYDPSQPDSQRWRLVELNGMPATEKERLKWENHKNAKTKHKVDGAPSDFLDLNHAVLISESAKLARFRIPLQEKAKVLLSVQDIDLVVTVDKQSGNVSGIGATLREPIKVLLGLAQITDLDVDLRINPSDEGPSSGAEEVEPGSTARVKMSRLGKPVEYDWSDFKRVKAAAGT